MKKLIIFCFFVSNCSVFAQHRKLEDEGSHIFEEVFDNTVTDPNRYTADNIVFTPNKTLEYDYYFEKNGKKYQFLFDRNLPAHHKNIPIDSLRKYPNVIRKINIEVLAGLDEVLLSFDKGWNQTTMVIKYLMANNEEDTYATETTGIIENEKNIWIHPPRAASFRVLQMIPFPQILFPIEIGYQYSQKKIGFDPFKYEKYPCVETYEVIGKETLDTNFGKLACTVVLQKNESGLGVGSLKHYFNEKYGFVKLEYQNVSNEKLVFTLRNVRNFLN